VARLYLQALGSFFVASYDTQGYSDFVIYPRGRPQRKHHFQQYQADLPFRCLPVAGLLLLRVGISRAVVQKRMYASQYPYRDRN
jgi:hypothetical protein